MEYLKEIIHHHAAHAHWFLFGAILLAGFNIPISADVLILIAALLAATVIPEHTWLLFTWLLVGCYLSAMCSYWVGRLAGKSLMRISWLSKLIPPTRLLAMQRYFDKYGLLTLLVGRFIPFGVRNCLFMSSGISRLSFKKFIAMDALACSLWYSTCFYLFFTLAHHIDALRHHLKVFNLCMFAAFSVTVIALIWYKRRRKAKTLHQ
jgi:membrane protein DedA with SNARE-associated domain